MPNLDCLIEIQRPLKTQDSAGQILVTDDDSNWARVRSVWAEVRSINATENFGAERKIGTMVRSFLIRWVDFVTHEHRILYLSEPYDIISIEDYNKEGRNHYLYLVGSSKN